MFNGLSAFPLTPMNEAGIDETAFKKIMARLVKANVNSLGVLGSTGSYAYLTRAERKRVLEVAIDSAGSIPVIAGIGALRTRHILELAEDAQKAGASAVLLAPVSYQKLTDEEVFTLYREVSSHLSVPMCVYDNPGTTHFTFSDELHARIAQLPNVASIKIPGVPADPELARARVDKLKSLIPADVSVGVSGDAFAALGMNAGCDLWYSVIGGIFPEVCQQIIRLSESEDPALAIEQSEKLQPLWALFSQYGSLRVVASIAHKIGLTDETNLPEPLLSLKGVQENAAIDKVITLLS